MRKVRLGSPTTWPFWTIVSVVLPLLSLSAIETTRSLAGLFGSKLNAIPPTWGNLPGVRPGAVSATPCSMTCFNCWAVKVNNVSWLLNLRLFSISNWEIWPACFPAAGLATGGIFCPAFGSLPPAPITAPIDSRIPPPFLIEITTLGSFLLTAAKLASAVKLPKFVSSVRTEFLSPLR